MPRGPLALALALHIGGASRGSLALAELSGRGVGLGALREACQDLGGAVRFASEPGHGTRLTCRVPLVR